LKKLIISLTAIAALCIIGLAFVIKYYKLSGTAIGEELAKSLLQLIVIIFLGQVISLIISEYDRKRQKAVALNDYRKNFLNKLIQIYVNYRRVRRELRANSQAILLNVDVGDNSKATINLNVLDNHMQEIKEIVYDLLLVEQELKAFHFAFSKPEDIIKLTDHGRKYFNNIVEEYEKMLSELKSANKDVEISRLPHLSDLLAPETSGERKDLGNRYEAIIQVITNDILVTQ